MKRNTLLFLSILFCAFATVKGQSGTIEFEEVTKFEIKLEGEMAQMMKDMPKEQRSDMMLYFSPEASLFEKVIGEKPMMGGEFAHAEAGVNIMMSTPDNKVFIDLKKKDVVEQKEFMTRTFLIEDKMPENDWKITGKQKMVLDYPCMEATLTDTAGVITRAWFTPAIAVQTGPSNFCNLPGLILEVDIKDGDKKFIAKSISLEAPDKENFKKPKEGKKVSREEFDKIVEEKMAEMGVEKSGSGNMIMIKIKN